MTQLQLPTRALLALLLVAPLAAGCGEDADPTATAVDAEPVQARPMEPPQVVSVTADALREEVREMDAEVVVLNVWATWCGPCRVEFPEFVRFGRDTGEETAVRFLSVDEPHDLARVQAFLEENGVEGRSFLTGEGVEIVGDLAAPYQWTYGIPATMIFGPDGELVEFWEGAVNYDFLQAKVQQVRDGSGGPVAL